MRVLVVHNRYRSAQPSGENAVVDEEVELLRERGVTVDVLATESDSIAHFSPLRRATLPVRVIWSAAGQRLVRDATAAFRPHVVHVHNTFPLLSPSALWAARRSGARVVQTLHNFRPLCPAGTFLRAGRVCESCLGRAPLPAIAHGCYRSSRAATVPVAVKDALHERVGTWRRCVDCYIAPSSFARAKYVQAGWPAERIAVKYNTVADPELPRAGSGEGFVCLSRLVPEKGVDVLLEAWRRAFPGGGQRLLVVGAGDRQEELRGVAAGLPGVEIRPTVERAEALRLLAGARALVVPSRWYEVFPRTVVEAYALGVPVIASRLGSLAEVVVDGETGLLVGPEAAGELAAGLRRLAADGELAARLGVGARRAYERWLSPEVTTDRLLAIYAGEPVEAIAGLGSAGEARLAGAAP
jgi:glycosyltransferase involved in cell wall biosynthesis